MLVPIINLTDVIMRLEKIKLAGFKSFVDPTVIDLQTNLTAVVGPNGCGKSNIVDAVMWVTGESSAKQLRGESMADVIFNGAGDRKPVGKAAVELIFDNSSGRVGGEYANYNQISIRREVERDGESTYLLNGVRCRRRDITDILSGTGLGPRSYALIGQGMISRIIEAKPEDLRIYLEEVAGISKYKERRRETETRIRHTRENLDRLNDLREEIEKQLNHLKRQANAAERYKELKAEQSLMNGQLEALLCLALEQQMGEQSRLIDDQTLRLEAKITTQRSTDTQIEKLRQLLTEHNDIVNEIQSRYYSLGAEIARLEQKINGALERRNQLAQDQVQVDQNWQELQDQLTEDQLQVDELKQEMAMIEPELESTKQQSSHSQQQLMQAEQKMNGWQTRWDEFNNEAAKTNQQVHVEQTRAKHLEQQIENSELRMLRLEEERQQLNKQSEGSEADSLAEQCTETKRHIEISQEDINKVQQQTVNQRNLAQDLQQQLDEVRQQLQILRAQRTSLEELQKVALGKNETSVVKWLEDMKLAHHPRLAEGLRVADGWDNALETVLGSYLEAVCLDQITPSIVDSVHTLTKGEVTLFITQTPSTNMQNTKMTTLLSKVDSDWPIAHLLNGIYIAENIQEALQLTPTLGAHESVVTRDGIWLNQVWLRINKPKDEKAGIIQREQHLQTLGQQIAEQNHIVLEKERLLTQAKDDLLDLEVQREIYQQQFRDFTKKYTELNGKLNAVSARNEQLHQREKGILHEIHEHERQLSEAREQLIAIRGTLQLASEKLETEAKQRETFIQQRDHYRQALEQTRERSRLDQQQVDELQVRLESSRSQLHFLQQGIQRAEKQIVSLEERRQALSQAIEEINIPLPEWQQELEQLLAKRLQIEAELTQARQQLENTEHELRELEKQRTEHDQAAQQLRSELEQMRMQQQALQIRRDTHQEQITKMGFEMKPLLENLPEGAIATAWQEKITQIDNRIQRLGAINLAAIDECAQLSERKEYLDAQNMDLMEALTTLETAIQKIDKETRTRFKETFNQVDQTFQQLFPKIFGGGKAYLELTGEDLLTTGIEVKAQPPGKRNATIHLLSGGEKALTAISLVFSLFQLNPAPFCILDEVDAPLDDANVGRFCNLVREMSQTVQFIFISHNKISISMAEQLTGVTMREAGVSRLVSVDVNQAMAMAEAA